MNADVERGVGDGARRRRRCRRGGHRGGLRSGLFDLTSMNDDAILSRARRWPLVCWFAGRSQLEPRGVGGEDVGEVELGRGARGAQPCVRRGGTLAPVRRTRWTATRGGDRLGEEGPEPLDVASLPAVGASGLARGDPRCRRPRVDGIASGATRGRARGGLPRRARARPPTNRPSRGRLQRGRVGARARREMRSRGRARRGVVGGAEVVDAVGVAGEPGRVFCAHRDGTRVEPGSKRVAR